MSDTPPKTLAEEVHEAELGQLNTKHRLFEAIDEVAPDAWEDCTTDWYDNSVEIYFPGEVPNADAVAERMFAAGFRLVWLHPHPSSERLTVAEGLCVCPVRVRDGGRR